MALDLMESMMWSSRCVPMRWTSWPLSRAGLVSAEAITPAPSTAILLISCPSVPLRSHQWVFGHALGCLGPSEPQVVFEVLIDPTLAASPVDGHYSASAHSTTTFANKSGSAPCMEWGIVGNDWYVNS